jgi:hypothetical protein
VKVWSRRATDFIYRFPAIAEAVRALGADQPLIDGEAVVLRNDGRTDFGALMTKRGGRRLQRLVAGASGIPFSEALAAEGVQRLRPAQSEVRASKGRRTLILPKS